MRYTFVHPTKTGGTAVEQYFKEHHFGAVRGEGHLHTCANSANPIVTLRHPLDRFVSIFQYWRNGAADGKYRRDVEDWVPVNTISEFIGKMRERDGSFVRNFLHRDFTTHLHFVEQRHWLKPADHGKTIVILYDKDGMDAKIRELLKHLSLPCVGLPIPRVNVTRSSEGVVCELTADDREWIERHYKADFDLWHLATKHPHRFKKVF